MLRAEIDGNAVCITTDTQLQKDVPERRFEVWIELTPEQLATIAMLLQDENNTFTKEQIIPVKEIKIEQNSTIDKDIVQKELKFVKEMIAEHKSQLGNIPLLLEFIEDFEEGIGLNWENSNESHI